ncbi:MAG: hypothetical protein JWM77_1160 [Rhodospirillales bacterium]|jgi:hypothetical protein|nr:hypothetical protein [Rhodospirillales bacterium]
MRPADAVLQLVNSVRGERPVSLASAETEQVLQIATALVIELAAAMDRIDRLERTVAELRGVPLAQQREAAAGAEAEAARLADVEAMIARALHATIGS